MFKMKEEIITAKRFRGVKKREGPPTGFVS